MKEALKNFGKRILAYTILAVGYYLCTVLGLFMLQSIFMDTKFTNIWVEAIPVMLLSWLLLLVWYIMGLVHKRQKAKREETEE
jgi:hypothetical protein